MEVRVVPRRKAGCGASEAEKAWGHSLRTAAASSENYETWSSAQIKDIEVFAFERKAGKSHLREWKNEYSRKVINWYTLLSMPDHKLALPLIQEFTHLHTHSFTSR